MQETAPLHQDDHGAASEHPAAPHVPHDCPRQVELPRLPRGPDGQVPRLGRRRLRPHVRPIGPIHGAALVSVANRKRGGVRVAAQLPERTDEEGGGCWGRRWARGGGRRKEERERFLRGGSGGGRGGDAVDEGGKLAVVAGGGGQRDGMVGIRLEVALVGGGGGSGEA